MSHQDPGWRPEADYALGAESVYVRWDEFRTEEKLLWKNPKGVWVIDDHLWAALEVGGTGDTHDILAGLL